MNVKVLLLPDGEDPDSYARTHSATDFVDFIQANQLDFIHFKTTLLLKEAKNDPLKKATAITDVLNSISLMQNAILVSEYVKLCSDLFEKSEAILYSELNKIKAKKNREEFVKSPDETVSPLVEKRELISLDTELDNAEKVILKFILQNGNETILLNHFETNELVEVKIAEYALRELRRDELEFTNSLHELFLKDLEKHIEEESFVPSSFFVAHQNPDVSLLAADLLTEKYQLSKIFLKNPVENQEKQMTATAQRRIDELKKQEEESRKKWLFDSVTNSINEYKMMIISMKISELERSLRDNTSENIVQIMKEHARLSEIKRILASALGQVVIK